MLWVRSSTNHAGVMQVVSANGKARTSAVLLRMERMNRAISTASTARAGQKR